MSSDISLGEEKPVEIVFQVEVDESSEEPPMEEWSSLMIDYTVQNPKRILYEEGLYDPGSGEICAKYIPMSDSAVFRHPYYNYPPVTDPGILKALLRPEDPIIYPDDGQEAYISVCNQMNLCPVRIFYRGLVDEDIDLRYYCVNPNQVYAMAQALKFNKNVQVLNLTDNFLNNDACFHLGDMLETNTTLKELNLSGCRIGPDGARRLFAKLSSNKTLITLNLNANRLGDTGIEFLAKIIFKGLNVERISLKNNEITGKSGIALAEAFETRNKFTHIDLSWNNMFGAGVSQFLNKLSESTVLQDLNLSWNSLSGVRVGIGLKKILKIPTLQNMILSNNKLEGKIVNNILANLQFATGLDTLDLSYNPLKPADALNVILKVQPPSVQVKNVYMKNVQVTSEFLEVLKSFKNIESKAETVVTYGEVISEKKIKGPDARDLVLSRMDYLCKKNKKMEIDIALFILQLEKDKVTSMLLKELIYALRQAKISVLDNDLIQQVIDAFCGGVIGKDKVMDVKLLVDYVRRKWPERKLPPTPPPESEPEPKKKGKKKKK